jgi:hypothetical protein
MFDEQQKRGAANWAIWLAVGAGVLFILIMCLWALMIVP